jgi:hypothetical protein
MRRLSPQQGADSWSSSIAWGDSNAQPHRCQEIKPQNYGLFHDLEKRVNLNCRSEPEARRQMAVLAVLDRIARVQTFALRPQFDGAGKAMSSADPAQGR